MDFNALAEHVAWLTEQVVALQGRMGVHPEQLPQSFDLLKKDGPAQSSNNGQALTDGSDFGRRIGQTCAQDAYSPTAAGCEAASQSARQGARRRA